MLSVPLALLYLPLSGSRRCEFCARFVLWTTRDHRYVICRRIRGTRARRAVQR